MSIEKQLNPFSNVVATGTAVLPIINQGMLFERIVLQRGGTTFNADMITAIRIVLGGKKIWEISGKHLMDLNEYYRETSGANEMNIWFADPRAKNRDDRLAGALDTVQPYSNFSMEVDISGATAPTLVAYAEQRSGSPKGARYKNLIRTITKSVHAPSAANEFSLAVPFGSAQGGYIRGVHLFHANVTKLQVVKDGFYLAENLANALNQAMQNNHSRTTQAGMLSWDPMKSDLSDDLVPMLRADGNRANFELKATVSAADTITAYSDLLQTHAGA